MLTAAWKLVRPPMFLWQENLGKDISNTKGSGSTLTGIGKDEPLKIPGGSGEKYPSELTLCESAEGKEKSCNQAHLLREVLKGLSPAFPVPSALGSHLNYYKVTVKRKHSKLVLFLISYIQECRAVGSLGLKSASFLCHFQVIINRAFATSKVALFAQAPIFCM